LANMFVTNLFVTNMFVILKPTNDERLDR